MVLSSLQDQLPDWFLNMQVSDLNDIFAMVRESIVTNPDTNLDEVKVIVREIAPDLDSEFQDRLALMVFLFEGLTYGQKDKELD